MPWQPAAGGQPRLSLATLIVCPARGRPGRLSADMGGIGGQGIGTDIYGKLVSVSTGKLKGAVWL